MHDELQRHNRRATVVLVLAGFTLLFLVAVAFQVLVFGFVGGPLPTTAAGAVPVLGLGLLVAGGGSAVAWWQSDSIALRSAGAVPADPVAHRDVQRLLEGVCLAAGIPVPRLYVVDDPAPNAFATGRNPENAAVAVTTGLVERMDRRELEAVLAHEVGHIVNRDLLTVTVAVTLAGATMLLADIARRSLWYGGMGGGHGRRRSNRDSGGGNPLAIVLLVLSILVVVLAPFAAQLIRFAVSRQREYLADATAVELTRDPGAMIGALQALSHDRTEIRTASRATAHLWIEEPLNLDARMNRAVATHPPLPDRIARLRTLWPDADVPRPEPTRPAAPPPPPGSPVSSMPPPPPPGSTPLAPPAPRPPDGAPGRPDGGFFG
ncbi:MAG: M48 family metallopeptidase [Actinomycetes bacterium]